MFTHHSAYFQLTFSLTVFDPCGHLSSFELYHGPELIRVTCGLDCPQLWTLSVASVSITLAQCSSTLGSSTVATRMQGGTMAFLKAVNIDKCSDA